MIADNYCYGGIDPGGSGHLVILWEKSILYEHRLTNDFVGLHSVFDNARFQARNGLKYRMLVEVPITSTGKGTKGRATQHQVYGVIFGLLMGQRYDSARSIHPATWRAYYKLPRKTDKNAHYRAAFDRFPELRDVIQDKGSDDGFIDALLIAKFAQAEWEQRFNGLSGIHRQAPRKRRSNSTGRRRATRRRGKL
jgi:hypothetical protein